MPPDDKHEASASERGEETEPPERLSVDFVSEAGDWQRIGVVEELATPVISAVTARLELVAKLPADVCVMLTDDAAMHRLNAHFRGKDKPTNVLSFPSGLPVHPGERRNLGDIALGFETVMREAVEQAVTPADHLQHLILHGLLHLMGYDHETDGDAAVMEALEIEILAGLGIANPYEEAAEAPTIR